MGMYIAKYQHFSHSVLKAETCKMIVRIANRDLDQTTASEKSDIGLHYLPWLWLLSRQPMFEISEHLRNEFKFWSVHGIMNTSPNSIMIPWKDQKWNLLYLYFILSVKYQFSIFT